MAMRFAHDITLLKPVKTWREPPKRDLQMIRFDCTDCGAEINLKFHSIGPPPYRIKDIRCPECNRDIILSIDR